MGGWDDGREINQKINKTNPRDPVLVNGRDPLEPFELLAPGRWSGSCRTLPCDALCIRYTKCSRSPQILLFRSRQSGRFMSCLEEIANDK